MHALRQTLVAAGLLLAASVPLPALAASADPLDIDPNLQARVARERLKQTQAQQGNRGNQPGGKSRDCGQIDIGNSDDDQSARNRVAPREKTVIVTGPVINATKC